MNPPARPIQAPAAIVAALGGRRFLLSMAAGVGTAVLQFFGKLDPAGTTYAMVLIGTVGAYIAGNTAQKWGDMKNRSGDAG
jgi:hypothetical protein